MHNSIILSEDNSAFLEVNVSLKTTPLSGILTHSQEKSHWVELDRGMGKNYHPNNARDLFTLKMTTISQRLQAQWLSKLDEPQEE